MVGELILAQCSRVDFEEGGQQFPVFGAGQIEGNPAISCPEETTASVRRDPSLARQAEEGGPFTQKRSTGASGQNLRARHQTERVQGTDRRAGEGRRALLRWAGSISGQGHQSGSRPVQRRIQRVASMRKIEDLAPKGVQQSSRVGAGQPGVGTARAAPLQWMLWVGDHRGRFLSGGLLAGTSFGFQTRDFRVIGDEPLSDE